MAAGVPAALTLRCPRCRILHSFVNVDGGTQFRCSGCEWPFTLSAVAPTGAATATVAAGATAITVASGGASFTAGMLLLVDTLANAEVVTVTSTGSATSIPVTAFIKGHTTGYTFGQLANNPTLSGFGENQVPQNAF
jgi:hypothetical protein